MPLVRPRRSWKARRVDALNPSGKKEKKQVSNEKRSHGAYKIYKWICRVYIGNIATIKGIITACLGYIKVIILPRCGGV